MEFKTRIEKIVPNGYGLGFSEGSTIFVSLAVKGDLLLVREKERKGKIIFAEIVEILEASPDRVSPSCKYFGECGGCNMQQMSYEAQLTAKAAIVEDCLKRIGRLELENPVEICGSPRDLGYRTRAEWHLDVDKKLMGYFRRGSHEVIDIDACPILVEDLQEELVSLRGAIVWNQFSTRMTSVEAAAAEGEVSVFSNELMEPTETVTFSSRHDKYQYDARTFFQGNPYLIDTLIDEAVGGASGKLALDLFCGVGLFTLPLARQFEKVIAVEGHERSTELAFHNAQLARLGNIVVETASVTHWMAHPPGRLTPDFVLVDPPRNGCDKALLEKIVEMVPKEISYVSCDPSTLARDLRFLCDAGYKIVSIKAFDLFPQTHHVETVVRLKVQEV